MSSICSSISMRAISTKLPQLNKPPKPPMPFTVSLPLLISSSSSSFSFKPISFQRLPTSTKPLKAAAAAAAASSSSSSVESIDDDEVPGKLQEIIKLFQSAQDPRSKYQQLMFYANKLPPLEEKHKTQDNKVEGCVSQVWVRAFLNENKAVFFEADSDSIMTKGLAALLVLGLSGSSVPDILRVSPDFIQLLGLQQNLTPSRNNGFFNMFKLMQRKALLLGLEAEQAADAAAAAAAADTDADKQVEDDCNNVVDDNDEVEARARARAKLGRRGERIREKLERELKPVELEVEDISYQHAGHVGVKDSDSDGETHFKVKIVSDEFQGKSLVKRHRMVYALLEDELQQGLHALSIIANTPAPQLQQH